jgi:hypothetical protein
MAMSLKGFRRQLPAATIAIALAALVLVFSAPPPTASASAAGRVAAQHAAGPAWQQLSWVIGASARAPLSAAEIEQHFAPQYLAAIGGPATVNQELAALGTLTIAQVLLSKPDLVHAIVVGSKVGTFEFELQTDTSGLILITVATGLSQVAAPRSWQELDTRLRALAPEVSFAAMTIGPDGSCHLVHGVDAATARPLGSSFKLYVLGALGQAIRGGRASWDEDLAIHEQWKSLPSGVLENDPAGTELTLREYADFMISISDNTAADHLIRFLGRDAVQAQLFRFGNRSAERDIPFLTTRELFALRSVDYPALADSYLADPRAQRAAELAALDQIPLSQLSGWTQPEMIDQIEWFASPEDMCRTYAGLWRENAEPEMSGIGGALSVNDGGIGLDPARYPLVWFKGGSEPGVLTLNYLARASDGQIIVSSLMLANPGSAFDETAAAEEGLALARGGILLASR